MSSLMNSNKIWKIFYVSFDLTTLCIQDNKQTDKQTHNKHTDKQTIKQKSKQTNKQSNRQSTQKICMQERKASATNLENWNK